MTFFFGSHWKEMFWFSPQGLGDIFMSKHIYQGRGAKNWACGCSVQWDDIWVTWRSSKNTVYSSKRVNERLFFLIAQSRDLWTSLCYPMPGLKKGAGKAKGCPAVIQSSVNALGSYSWVNICLNVHLMTSSSPVWNIKCKIFDNKDANVVMLQMDTGQLNQRCGLSGAWAIYGLVTVNQIHWKNITGPVAQIILLALA